ncbi:PREDICTED: ubiquitin-associated protein 1-like [Gekko japonicus]|uniref:Ubiquitin-associated protein 1-like n=1 Tax=Gekko japonicus TaxID=146911 RepID=A0ABM1K1A9_GEKJA|nr:PREDICTED: ubiquitin-associated protein 1-like [Gekko japonicus]
MSCLEDVPFRMSSSFVDDAVREANFVRAPEVDMPDCEEILTSTMHDFSLEKRVLCWVESASWQDTPWSDGTTDVIPTAPPYWLFMVDSEENSHEETGENTAEETPPVQRCASPAGDDEAQPIVSANGDQQPVEDEDPKGEGSSSAIPAESNRKAPPVSEAKQGPGALARFFGLPQPKPRTPPVPSAVSSEGTCPKPALVKQSQSLLLLKNVKNELERAKGKLAAFLRPLSHSFTESSLASRAFPLSNRSRNNRNLRHRSASDSSTMGTVMPVPPSTILPRASSGSIPPIQKHKPTVACLSPDPSLPPPPGAQPSPGSHGTPVLALGYPIRRAILALQKTGKQSLGQFLSYLSACDKLLKQGYDEAQVEEAMEMFQNSEKAAEFLHLLARFNDMGFQQADIKEVLLLCENQGDNALEELMTRAQ